MGNSGSQCSPDATIHAMRSGIVMMIDQVDPAESVSTSTTPPLFASPMATGASLYFLAKWVRALARSVHERFGWAASAMLLPATTDRTSPANRLYVLNM
jgi:hypothetical protein